MVSQPGEVGEVLSSECRVENGSALGTIDF
jgi:hypothetical protein